MATQLTIRGVSQELSRRLTRLGKDQGRSVNTTALEILERAVGLSGRRERLDRYMTVTTADADELDAAIREQRVIDDAQWR
jgi:hypothetical protein